MGLVAAEEVGQAVVGQGVEVVEGRDSAGLTTSVGRSARAVNECWPSSLVQVGPHRWVRVQWNWVLAYLHGLLLQGYCSMLDPGLFNFLRSYDC